MRHPCANEDRRQDRLKAIRKLIRKLSTGLKGISNMALWLDALATLALVIISWFALCQGLPAFRNQVRVKAMELRPYLLIEHKATPMGRAGTEAEMDYQVTFGFCDPPTNWEDESTWTSVSDIDTSALSDSARFCYRFGRRLIMKNVGASPLLLTHFHASTLSEDEWIRSHSASVDSLYAHLAKPDSGWDTLSVDVTLMKGDSRAWDYYMYKQNSVLWSEFNDQLVKKDSLVFYPYSIARYIDQIGTVLDLHYCTLYMEQLIFPFVFVNDRLSIDPPIYRRVQKFRFITPHSFD